MFTTTN